jgi:hypothetical protein
VTPEYRVTITPEAADKMRAALVAMGWVRVEANADATAATVASQAR